MNRLRAKSLAMIVVLMASLIVAMPAQAQPKECLPGVGKEVPVLLVHGFRGSVASWKGVGSIYESIEQMDGAYVDSFNYEDHNLKWVTDKEIGPRLAKEISCLAQSSREGGGKGKVIVIGVSMGGLAIQFAASQTVNGRRVADDIGLVIAIGSPFEGSQLADWSITLMRAFCAGQHITLVGGKTISVDPDDCEAMADTYTAVGGLRQNSAKLRELPLFPPDVAVHTIAGNVQEARFNIFGVELKSLNTDLAVTIDSATKGNAHPSRGGGKSVVECVAVWPIPGFSDASCEHGHLLQDKNVRARVVDAVNQYLRRLQLEEARARFAGTWQVHGSVVTFNQDGTGDGSVNYGPCGSDQWCRGKVEFNWEPTGEGLTYTVTSSYVVALTDTGSTPMPNADTSDLEQPGTVVTAKLVRAGLLVRSPWGRGNPYLCSPEVSATDLGKCGA